MGRVETSTARAPLRPGRPAPRHRVNPIRLIAAKEGGELVISGRGAAWLLAVAVVLSVFSLLFVSNTELGLLDNAQVVYDMTGAVTALGALLAVIVGVDAIGGERERNSLVPLLLAPISRMEIVAGKMGGQLIAWAAIFVLAIPYLWAVGSTGQNLLDGILVVALFGTPVVLSFGFFALGLGTRMSRTRGALMTMIIGLIVSASPLLLGPSLRQSAIGRAFDAVNPFSAALNAYDAVIIDSQAIVAQWDRLVVVLVWLVVGAVFAVAAVKRIAR